MFTGAQLVKFLLTLCLYIRLNILHPRDSATFWASSGWSLGAPHSHFQCGSNQIHMWHVLKYSVTGFVPAFYQSGSINKVIRRQELKGGRTKEQQHVCQLMHWSSFHKLVSPLKGLRGTFIFCFSLELAEKLLIEKVMFEDLEILQPALENILGWLCSVLPYCFLFHCSSGLCQQGMGSTPC